ncbi:hypothetical protein B0H14DRAFT_3873560 [Mycena olivaceomarginata]|nr:hypothetical protein B0H14DRAFT_3873560 [Mycena olivaceomarginata]
MSDAYPGAKLPTAEAANDFVEPLDASSMFGRCDGSDTSLSASPSITWPAFVYVAAASLLWVLSLVAPPRSVHRSRVLRPYPSIRFTLTHAHTQAWSSIVHTLISNAAVLSKHLTIFADACSATEVILFERTTFLVIATSPPPSSSSSSPSTPSPSPSPSSPSSSSSPEANTFQELEATRYERTSELIKAFKHSCSRVREEFHSLEMELPEFSAVLDEMTENTYVLIIVHDPTIETAALKLNIRMARRKFEELQGLA